MSLVKNADGVYEADIRSEMMGRLHLSLRTKKQTQAINRHAAIEKLVREGHADLIEQLRRRKLTVEAIETCAREKKDFDSLRARTAWPTIEDAIEQYVQSIRANPNRQPTTADTAATQLAAFRTFVVQHSELGALARLDTISSKHFTEYQSFVASSYAKNSATAYLSRVGSLYRWAQRAEEREAKEEKRGARLIHSPIDVETLPKGRTMRRRFLSFQEAERLLAAAPDQLRFPIAVGLYAGLRVNEMLNLRRPPFDIDLELGLIIVQERDGWRPKTGKRREVPIANDLRPILERHLARYAGDTYLVTRFQNRTLPQWPQVFAQHFRRIVTDAGLVAGRARDEGVVYHTLRHSFASWLVMRGEGLYEVAQLLGNSLKMVESTYAHLSPDYRRRAIERLTGLVKVPAPLEDEAA